MAFDYTTPQNILSTVKHNLGLEDDTAQDSLINALIQGVIAAFNTQCSTSFVEHKVFEHQFFIKCGELLRTFVLPYLPVVTITGVVSDDTTITYEEGDYKLLKASGILIFQYDVTPEQIITVSGTYGYSLIPENVGLAISTQVLFLFGLLITALLSFAVMRSITSPIKNLLSNIESINAQIQEEGGTIRASGGGWLTVPLEVNKDARKILFTLAGNNKGGWTSARDFDNTFLQLSKKGNLIIFQNKGKKIIPLFILQSQVQIKPKYYLRDGIKAGSGKVFDDVMKQVVSEIMVGTF